MKDGRFSRGRIARAVASVLFAGFAPVTLLATPEGGEVAGGSAVIQRSGANLTVDQASDRAAINWHSFGIAPNEAVRFNQPSASSIALNRVLGQSPSEIFGSLSANGQVFLLNPNGILFAPGSQVDVGGLVASTLGLSNADFFAGRYTLTKGATAGPVVNQGTITAANGGYVGLLGPQVRNEGVVTAQLGSIALAAGSQVTVNLNGTSLVSIAVDKGVLDALVENRQIITADGGQVILSARAADALARSVVNNTGIVTASTISNIDGVIRLEGGSITNSGTLATPGGGSTSIRATQDVTLESTSVIAASGARGGKVVIQAEAGTLQADGRIEARGTDAAGGSVELLGERVGVVNQASIEASGRTGGGTVLVGGDYQGRNPGIQNASRTYVGPQATIKADATEAGNGGKVVVWADEVTRYYGSTSARGGSRSGNGGLVEVSGQGQLDFRGVVDTTAPRGNIGTLLLDPTNVEVITGGSAALGDVDQFADPDLTTCANLGDACSQIDPVTINVAAANVTLQATDSLLFTNAISMANPGVGLSATAQTGSITVNAPITTANRATSGTTGAVTLTAGTSIAINAVITTGDATAAGTGAGDVPASGAITLSAGTSVTGNASGQLITGAAELTGPALGGRDTAKSGSISVTAGTGGASGGIGFAAAGNALTTGNAARTGAVTDTATVGDITLASRDEINNGTASGALGFTFGTATGGATNNTGAFAVTTSTAAGNVFVSSATPLEFGASTVAGNLNATAAGAIAQSDVLAVTGTSSFNAGASAITLTDSGNDFTGAVSLTNSGANDVSIRDTNAIVLGTANVGSGTLTVQASGGNTITQTGAITQAPGATGASFTTGGGVITLTQANDFTGPVSLTNTGGANAIQIIDVNAIQLGAIDTQSDLTVNAVGITQDAGGIKVDGASILNAGVGVITLTAATNNLIGAVSLNNSGANDVSIRDTNAIVLGTSSVGSGTLAVQTNGTITQNGPITQAPGAGAASFTTGGNAAITLTNAGNDFTGAVTAINTGGSDISITTAHALALATVSSGGGDLFLVTDGPITQFGPITAGGKTRITAGAANEITLAHAANVFSGEMQIVSGNNVTLNDTAATFKWGNGGASTILGNLVLTTNGPVTQTQPLLVGGTTSINAGNDVIALTNAGNDFTGAVSAINPGTSDISITNANALVLGSVSPGTGDLFLVAGGAITQLAPLLVGGRTRITAGANDVTLNDAGNQLTGQVRIVSGNNVTLRDGTALAFGNGGNSSISGNLSLTAAGPVTQANAVRVDGTSSINAGANAITLTDSGNDFTGAVFLTNSGANDVSIRDTNAIVLGASSVGSGTLTVRGSGGNTITQTGAITQAPGAAGASFTTGGGVIALTHNGNDFTGPVSAINSGAADISITDANALALGPVNTGGGDLFLIANGAFTQTGALTVGGHTSITAGAANDITLADAANKFTGEMRVVSGNNVTLNDTAATFKWGNAGASTILGNLVLTTNGPVTQTEALLVGGTTSINAGNDVIALTNSGNDFTGAVSAINTGASDISITDANALVLGTVSPGTGDLFLVANGAITQAGPLTVGGRSSITAGAANDITLAHAANVFTGEMRVVSGNNVTLNDTAATFKWGNAGASTILGNLVLTTNGPVTQTQALLVGGTTAIDAGANAITLTDAGNNFTGAMSLNNSGGNNVSITDTDALVLGSSSLGNGTLDVTAGGNITQTGAITQAAGAGTATFTVTAAGSDIQLSTQANNFSGAFAFGGTQSNVNDFGLRNINAGALTPALTPLTNLHNLTLQFDNAAIDLPTFTTTAGGDAAVIAGGAITQGGPVVVAGTSSFSAGANPITLTDTSNDFAGAVSLNNSGPDNVAITDANAIVLGTSSVGTGTLTVNATGANSITQSGAITQASGAGAADFTTGAGAITLTSAANDFTGAVSLINSGANDASVTDTNALTLASSTIGRNLSAVADGRLTLTGTLATGGSAGTSIELAGQGFTNTAGAGALAPGAGSRFLVWSSNPDPFSGGTLDDRDGLAYDFKQYNATFGVTTPAQATGDAFLYALAPSITVGLIGTVGKTYDGSTAATLAAGNYTTSGAVDGDTITLNNPAAGTYDTRNAGTGKNVSVSGIALSSATNGTATVYGYQLATTANADIGEMAQRAITVTAQTDTKIYDGSTSSAVTPVITAGTLAPVGGDTAGFIQTFNNRDAGSGKTLTATGSVSDGNSGNNYALTFVADNTGVINQRAITVTAQTDTRAYDGSTSSAVTPLITAGSLAPVGGDTESFTQTFNNRNAGSGKTLTATGSVSDGNSGNNYALTFVADNTGVINQRAITVTAQTDTRTYDGSTSSAATAAITAGTLAPVGGDTVGFTQAFDNRNAGSGKTLSASGSVTDGNSGNNYAVTFVADNTGVIYQRAITVTAQTDTRTYDGSTGSAVTPLISSGSLAPVGGDTAGFTQAFNNRNAGTVKTLTTTGSVGDGNSGNNYAVTFVADNTGVINQRAITVTAQTDTRTYDGSTSSAATPVITAGTLAPVGGDSATFIQAFNNRNAGSGKTLSASGSVTDGNSGNNYAVTLIADNAGVINQRAITVTAQTDTRTYDGSTSSAVTPAITAGTLAPVGGDTAGFVQTFNNRSAGTGKTLTAAGLVNDGNAGANYQITYATNNTGVITAAPLIITADDKSREALQPNPLFTATYSGFVPGEGVSDLLGTLFFTTPASTASPPGPYAIVPSGHSAVNYTISYVNGTLTVTPASVTPPASAGRAYEEALASAQQRLPYREPIKPRFSGQIYGVESTGIRLPAGLAR